MFGTKENMLGTLPWFTEERQKVWHVTCKVPSRADDDVLIRARTTTHFFPSRAHLAGFGGLLSPPLPNDLTVFAETWAAAEGL